MEIKTAQSNLNQARFAVQQVALSIGPIEPQFIVVAASPAAHFEKCQVLLHESFPSAQIVGCSSFDGVMTEEGLCQSETGCSLGVWALSDPKGSYGAGICHSCEKQSVEEALDLALENAGRSGELPTLIWLLSSTRKEEEVLQELTAIVGDTVPVVGGGASTSMVEQEQALASCNGVASEKGIVLAVLFPSGQLGYSFHSGCTMVKPLGRVTKVEGAALVEIDNKPALEVYEASLGESLEQKMQADKWSDIPIGRLVGEHQQLPMFTLSLPFGVDQSAILLSAPVQEGERLFLMKGSKQGLKERSKRVLTSAMEMLPEGRLGMQPVGALLVYCACCMQLVANDLNQENQAICQTLGEQSPHLTLFTEGEIGPLVHSQNVHGNLMIASVVFYGTGDGL